MPLKRRLWAKSAIGSIGTQDYTCLLLCTHDDAVMLKHPCSEDHKANHLVTTKTYNPPTAPTPRVYQRQRLNMKARILYDFLPFLCILLGAMLGAVQFRVQGLDDQSMATVGDTASEVGYSFSFDTAPSGTGWHSPEDGAIWMSSTESTLQVPLGSGDRRISLRVLGFQEDMLNSLLLRVNGVPVDLTRDGENGWEVFRGVIPPDVIGRQQPTVITFLINRTVSPAALDLGPDTRQLGLRFDSIEFSRVTTRSAQPPLMFLLIIVAAVVGTSFQEFLRVIRRHRPDRKRYGFISAIVSLLVALTLIVVLIPSIARAQLIFFVVLGVIIASMTILWAPSPRVAGRDTSMVYHLRKLWENRMLLGIWTRYNVLSRYSQAFLGIVWIIIQPLATSIVLAFVFSQVMRIVDTGGAPFISFYMSAIIVWTLFSAGLANGSISLIAASGLITQVYFPREILVIVKLGETMVDVSFTFVALIAINALVGVFPNVAFIYLPILLVIQIALMVGIMLFVSYLSMMIRDVPQLINIILQFMFYLTPILYPADLIPDQFRGLVVLNPLAILVDAYRDVILYNHAPDFVSLYYPTVLAGVLLYTGYMFFKKYERQVADYV